MTEMSEDSPLPAPGRMGAEPHRAAAAARRGLLLGVCAVVFWSFGSSLVCLGAREAGTWSFVAIASLTGGLLQIIFRRAHAGELRSALLLPWRLWAVPLVCFVIYGLAWPWALASSTSREVIGVNLINYLWPVLTVLFSCWWVPGVRLTPRLALALALGLLGLGLANLGPLRELFLADAPAGSGPGLRLLPYLLGAVAAVTWAVYSAVLARWRGWAKDYVTSPLGFILIGLVALAVTRGSLGTRLTPFGALMTFVYGAGPLAAGYLLWELALPKARIQSLSLVAAATPVLSTLLLCGFLQRLPGPELVLAALLVAAAALLSMRE